MSVSLFIASLPYLYYINSGYLQLWRSQLSQIFWRYSLDVCTLVPNNFRFIVCLSVCALPHFLTEIRLSLDISSSRGAIFFKFSGDIPGMFLHQLKIISGFLYICQSVHCLTSLLKLGYLWISQVVDKLSFFQIFRRHSWDVFALVQNNLGFLVCLSVCSLPHFLTDIMLTVDISSSG